MAKGQLKSKIQIQGCNFSKTAKKIIEQNGGSIINIVTSNKVEKKSKNEEISVGNHKNDKKNK